MKITEDYFEKYKDDYQFDKSNFKTEEKIEVRIPFTGYYSIKVKCKDPQIAMAEVLKASRDIGITSIIDMESNIEEVLEKETYAIE